jgi:dTDP-glucose 4,6-dehydratase
MKPKSLLVIGGTGFFGKSILKYFINNNYLKKYFNKVFILSRNKLKIKKIYYNKLKKNFHIIKINSNISNVKSLPCVDYVIYAALLKSYNEDHKALKRYLALAKKYHPKSKILYIGSGAVYGVQNTSINGFSENYLKFNKTINFKKGYKKKYSNLKLKNEELFKNFGKKGGKVSIARCFSFVGEYLPRASNYVLGNFIKSILNNKKININSNYKIIRSYMHSDDLVKWLLKILFNSNRSCPIYNVGSNDAVDIHEIALLLAKKYNLNVSFKTINIRKTDKYVPNIDKAKKHLGLKNKLNSLQAIIKTVNLLKKNYEAC